MQAISPACTQSPKPTIRNVVIGLETAQLLPTDLPAWWVLLTEGPMGYAQNGTYKGLDSGQAYDGTTPLS